MDDEVESVAQILVAADRMARCSWPRLVPCYIDALLSSLALPLKLSLKGGPHRPIQTVLGETGAGTR